MAREAMGIIFKRQKLEQSQEGYGNLPESSFLFFNFY